MHDPLSFSELREASTARQRAWPGSDAVDIAFRAIEVAGEVGEMLETVKKLLREQRGIAGSTATLSEVAEEMGDCIIAIDLLAADLGLDLGLATRTKFDATSDKYGLPVRIGSAQPEKGPHQ